MYACSDDESGPSFIICSGARNFNLGQENVEKLISILRKYDKSIILKAYCSEYEMAFDQLKKRSHLQNFNNLFERCETFVFHHSFEVSEDEFRPCLDYLMRLKPKTVIYLEEIDYKDMEPEDLAFWNSYTINGKPEFYEDWVIHNLSYKYSTSGTI